MKRRRFDVLILGYYGFGNLGDELLLEALVNLLKNEGVPIDRIAILSAQPQEQVLHASLHYIDRWDIKDVCSALKESKTLLLGGGGLFQDTSSIKSCFYYWGVLRLAKLFGCKIWAVGQSVGPLRTQIGRFLAKNALQLCEWISVRDNHSRVLLQSWGMSSFLTPDVVFFLPLSAYSPEPNGPILLNIRPWKNGNISDVIRLAMHYAKTQGTTLRGVAFSKEDQLLYEALQKAGDLPDGSVTLVRSVGDFKKVIDGARGAIGMRLHFVILSILCKLPVFAISYDPKVAAVADAWNIHFWPDTSEVTLSAPTSDEKMLETKFAITHSFKEGYSHANTGVTSYD